MKNPVNKILLWLFLLPTSVYRKLDVDLLQLRAILMTKLIMDDRRATGLYKARRRNQDKEISTATLFTVFTSFLMGATFLLAFFLKDDLTRLTFYLGIFSFILSLFLITDFSDILIDAKDNYIILPKPVSPNTFTVARLLHILIHLSKIVIPLSFPGLVMMAFSRGIWGSFGLLICILLLTLLTFAFVNAIYLLIIRVFSPGRLNSIITSLQIVFTVIMYGSYQLLPRLLDRSDIADMVLYPSIWLWIVPVYWFAKMWVFLFTLSFQPGLIMGFALSLASPLLGIWLVVRYLAPAFFRKLSLIHSDVPVEKIKKKNVFIKSSGFISMLSGMTTSSISEREAFLFTWRMTNRVRDFKMKVYPQIGYMFVLLVLFGYRSWNELVTASTEHQHIDDSRVIILILSIIYFTGLVFMGAMLQLSYTELFKAAWIYFVSPLQQPGKVIRGAIKACLSKFLAPIALLITLLGLIFFGTSLLSNLLFGFGNVFLMCSAFSWLAMDKLPFSVSSKNLAKGQITSRSVFMMIALPFFGIPHFFLFHHPVILYVLSAMIIPFAYVILYFTKNIHWDFIKED